MGKLLSVKNLSVEFANKKSRLTAVNGVSFELYSGVSLGIVGESGSGKSMLVSALIGLLPRNALFSADEVNFDGKNLVDIENIYVVTNEMYKNLVSEHIPDIPEANIIIEPASKNTAPCIGLAAVHIAKKDTNSKMIILPSDHLIKFNEIFIDTLKTALDVVEKDDNLATIGITPNYPETGYGYINFKKGD